MKKIFITAVILGLFSTLLVGCSRAVQRAPSTQVITPASSTQPGTPSTSSSLLPSPTTSTQVTTPATSPQPGTPSTSPSLAPSPTATNDQTATTFQTDVPLKVTDPVDASTLTENNITVKGTTSPGAVVTVNDQTSMADNNGNFSIPISVDDGVNAIDVTATDANGKQGEVLLMVNVAASTTPSSASSGVSADQTAVPLTVTQPVDGANLNSDDVTIQGQTSPGAAVCVNDASDVADSNGNFSIPINLNNGPNVIDVTATDDNGNQNEVLLMVSVNGS